MSNRKIAAIFIMTWGIIIQIMQTKYFGDNLFPKSIAELIFDAVCSAAFAYGLYLLTTNKTTTP